MSAEKGMTQTDFVALMRRSKRFFELLSHEFPEETSLNLMTALFTYLIFSSGNMPLGQILANVGNLHDMIMMAKGSGELTEIVEDLKKEDGMEEEVEEEDLTKRGH